MWLLYIHKYIIHGNTFKALVLMNQWSIYKQISYAALLSNFANENNIFSEAVHQGHFILYRLI